MCDSQYELDLTKLETYIIERPMYADTRRQAYADWALNELLIDILAEFDTPPWWYSGEYEIPYERIINRFIQKMRHYRNLAKPGRKLMFSIAIKEAESLRTVFVKKGLNDEDQQQFRKSRYANYKDDCEEKLSENSSLSRNRIRSGVCWFRDQGNHKSNRDRS